MCPLVVVLFPVKNSRVSITELPAAVFTLVDLPHPVGRQVLLQVACSGKALFTELTLPGLVFVVYSVDVHFHIVPAHEHLVALWAGNALSAFNWESFF